jgi:hypothetical protein
LLSFLCEQYRDQNGVCQEGEERETTYNGVPLEMLVDEPKGSDRGHDSEETGYNPTHIMRYEVRLRPINSVKEHVLI